MSSRGTRRPWSDPRAVPLMLDSEGNIAETHMGNFFFVSGGKLCTPTDKNVLGGITRTTLFELAGDLGIPVMEGNFTPYDVYSAGRGVYRQYQPDHRPGQEPERSGDRRDGAWLRSRFR